MVASALVSDGFGAAGASAVAAAGAGTFGAASACGGIACLMSCLSTGVGGAPKASETAVGIAAGAVKASGIAATGLVGGAATA